jgi:hypothetical protein
MEITLQTVRETLRNAFGRDSFVASFIKSVSSDENCCTACIDASGVMRYNPSFVKKHITGPADLFTVVTHELMHPMFGHFVYQSGQLENIGADMLINATISQVFAQSSGKGGLFRRFYKPIGLEGLLRPGSLMHQSRYARLYSSFYESTTSASLSTGEVIQTLKVLTPSVEMPTIMLIGSHGQEEQPQANPGARGTVPPFPADTLSRIAEDLKRIAERPGGCGAGYGQGLYTFLLEVLKTHMSLKRALLERFTTRQKVDRFRRTLTQPRISVSPIPLQPSKRDFVLLAAGMPPLHYHNHAQRVTTQTRGLAIYLDVSGSVNQHLPEIIGLLRSLRTELKTIFLFSNKVVEVPFRTLLAGHIETTYGTDFNCIAEHILANRYDKAVILTDGYASMTGENQKQLKERVFKALTVLFGGRSDSPELEALGDVVQLDEVTE